MNNARHPWVDPEQIRKLAERLMAPYAGLESAGQEIETAQDVTVPGGTDQSACVLGTKEAADSGATGLYGRLDDDPDVQAAGSWRLQPSDAVGMDHPLRREIAGILPGATGYLRGPRGEVCFDDGDFGSLHFLAGQLAALGETGGWLQWSLQAGQTVRATAIGVADGIAVLILRHPESTMDAETLEQIRQVVGRQLNVA